MTHTPAKLLNATDKIGTLASGKLANFLITSGNIFDEKTTIHHNWILGKPNVLKSLDAVDLAGEYILGVGEEDYLLRVKGELGKQEFSIFVNDSTTTKVKHSYQNGLLSMSFVPHEEDKMLRLTGAVGNPNWSGTAQLGDGTWVKWSTVEVMDSKTESNEEKAEGEKPAPNDPNVGEVIYPMVAYGWTEQPKQETVLFKNATVWTNEADSIMTETDVLIKNGKISQIGQGLSAGGATEVDATGMHLTSGIIDEHSHIAISRGVNECTQESTAEVRIGDVIDSDDVDIYRQLAGGVTVSQLLHGSCNPIGGQSAVIKLRWGYAPEDMKFEGAAGFIKFALGENVKRSRSSSNNRFPDSRMGVEQVYVDYFTRAKEYQQRQRTGDPTLRRDLDLETIGEILDSKRFITCHSYVQSEINMLMHLSLIHI